MMLAPVTAKSQMLNDMKQSIIDLLSLQLS